MEMGWCVIVCASSSSGDRDLPFTSIYEGRQFVLFCSYEIHQTIMLQIVFLMSLESSQRGGVHGLGSMMFGLVVQKFLNIE
jgi:hypothetical protein